MNEVVLSDRTGKNANPPARDDATEACETLGWNSMWSPTRRESNDAMKGDRESPRQPTADSSVDTGDSHGVFAFAECVRQSGHCIGRLSVHVVVESLDDAERAVGLPL